MPLAEAVAVATAQLVLGLIADVQMRGRRSRRAYKARIKKLADEFGVPASAVSAVESWLNRPEVAAWFLRPEQDAIEATLHSLRSELAASGVEASCEFAATVASNVHRVIRQSPALTPEVAHRLVVTDLADLKSGQWAIFDVQMRAHVSAHRRALGAAEQALKSSDYEEAAAKFLLAADEAATIDATGAEAAAVAKAAHARAERLRLSRSRTSDDLSALRDLVVRHTSIVPDHVETKFLEALEREESGADNEAKVLLASILESDETTDAEQSRAWASLLNIALASGDEPEARSLLDNPVILPINDSRAELAAFCRSVRLSGLTMLGHRTEADIEEFCSDIRALVTDHAPATPRIFQIVNGIHGVFIARKAAHPELRVLVRELAFAADDLPARLTFALQDAVSDGTQGDIDALRGALASASIIKRQLLERDPDAESKVSYGISDAAAKALTYAAARTEDLELKQELASEAIDHADDALRVANMSSLGPDSDALRGSLKATRGDAHLLLGDSLRAARDYTQALDPSLICDARYVTAGPGGHAWIGLADAQLRLGNIEGALATLRSPPGEFPEGSAIAGAASDTHEWIVGQVVPFREWMLGPSAQALQEQVKDLPPHQVIAETIGPPMSSWTALVSEAESPVTPEAFAINYDAWARGGFAHLAAIISGRPTNSIVVEARSVAEVRARLRTLSLLFDTVVVLWRGPLSDPGLTMGLFDADYSGPGGHGYTATGVMYRDRWFLGQGWAHLLPDDVSRFLVGEARRFLEGGRLVLLPAVAVGCMQVGLGSTDLLLTEGLLGGVPLASSGSAGERTLDLVETHLPYFPDVPLDELVDILDSADDELAGARSFVLGHLNSDALRGENWLGIRQAEEEIRAGISLVERFVCRHFRDRYRMESLQASISATETTQRADHAGEGGAGIAAFTDTNLAPWIPLWRMSQFSRLAWSAPLDRRAAAPVNSGRKANWLVPGTFGWTIPTVSPAPGSR